MLYGLDKRRSDDENGTDLGVARKMSRDNELPHARAIPIRTLHARLRAALPDQSAYSDGWHMNHELDKASGAFMYTLLTGHCAPGDEPEDRTARLARLVSTQNRVSDRLVINDIERYTPCLEFCPPIRIAEAARSRACLLSVSLGPHQPLM